ncbi:MAG TPA: DegV family protein [Thermoanaerobacterales bacterium]|nr:DegV family protein [Thermoanaerobacterales bacterium]
MNIKIISDSACDLPEEVAKKYDIDIIPFHVLLDDIDYLDGETIKSKELYEKMREGKMPKTSQVTPKQFIDVFTKNVKKEKKCLYIGFSSKMSGACQTGYLAAQHVKDTYPDSVIEVVDSEGGALAQGLSVYTAARMAQEGSSFSEIIEEVSIRAGHTEHIFSVDDLEYLFRGGRVNRVSSFVGGILNIKPILHVKEGRMIPTEKIRGKTKAIKRIVEIMEERGENLRNQTVAISHADDIESAMRLKKLINDRFGTEKFLINSVGCVLGSHIGIGGVAAFFLNKDYYKIKAAG